MEKIPLLVVVGPTASGKTSLSIKAAQLLHGEIVSADSRQVYRGLDIGSGKVTREEMNGVPHHLLDVANPSDVYSVAQFCDDARKAIVDIHSRGKLPILCGGSAFWVYALVDNWNLPEVKPNPDLRATLSNKSTDELFKQLQQLDPVRAANIDAKNPVRLIRAIEVATELGAVPEFKSGDSLYDPAFIGIDISTEHLHANIHTRLLDRMDSGMVEEVEKLHADGLSWERMETLGLEYRYLARFLQGTLLREEMLTQLEHEIIAFSKRQMTWFKKDKRIEWLSPTDALRRLPTLFAIH